MINKKKLKYAVNTLLFSWNGDTPDEVIWAFNDLMKALNMKAHIHNHEDTESEIDAFEKELKNHVF